jgi:hypothetical protein
LEASKVTPQRRRDWWLHQGATSEFEVSMFVGTLPQPTLTKSGPDHGWLRLTAENDRRYPAHIDSVPEHHAESALLLVTFALGDEPDPS